MSGICLTKIYFFITNVLIQFSNIFSILNIIKSVS